MPGGTAPEAGDHLLASYDYRLPRELIAQRPLETRDSSRLLVLRREGDALGHHRFFELDHILDKNHILVINRTRVLPARLAAKRATGASVDILVLEPAARGREPVKALARGKLIDGETLLLEDGTRLTVARRRGKWAWLAFPEAQTVSQVLQRLGNAPLPPYIRRNGASFEDDLVRYQTVYAREPGSVAAPTAGLHFTPGLMEKLSAGGIEVVDITLHVGVGTFLPVGTEDVREHRMEEEDYSVAPAAARAINRAKDQGKRVIAVGTTVVRALESLADDAGRVRAGAGKTGLFIYPGHRFRVVDGMVTNFHLPGSTLILLVAALVGRRRLLRAYDEAVALGYRFYSYGDAMLIL